MRIKRYFSKLVNAAGLLFFLWMISLVPVSLLKTLAAFAFGASFLVLCVLGFMYFRTLRKLGVFLLLLAISTVTLADSEATMKENCAPYQGKADEYNVCLFRQQYSSYGPTIGKYLQKFNIKQLYNGKTQASELQDVYNKANILKQNYAKMPESGKASYSYTCRGLTTQERLKSAEERAKIIKQNALNSGTPMCYAEAMQNLYNMYTAQHGERLIETVPMMLVYSKSMKCWPCDLVYILSTLANVMAYRSAPQMAAVAFFFLKWGLVFWLLFKVAMVLINRNANGKPYSGKEFFHELFIRLMCASLAAILLFGTAAQYDEKANVNTSVFKERSKTELDEFYEAVVNPVFSFISGIAIQFTQGVLEDENLSLYGAVLAKMSDDELQQSAVETLKNNNYCNPDFDLSHSELHYNLVNGGFITDTDVVSQGYVIQKETIRSFMCLSQLAFNGPVPLSAVGSIFTSYASENGFDVPWLGNLPNMMQLILGVSLTISCWFLSFSISLKIIDIIVRLAIVVMLCPCFIAFAVFPLTRQYAQKGLKFFFSAAVGMIEMSLAIAFAVPFLYAAIRGRDGSTSDKLIDAIVAEGGKNYVPNLYDQFTDSGLFLYFYLGGAMWLSFQLLKATSTFFENVLDASNVTGLGGSANMNTMIKEERRNVGSVAQFATSKTGQTLGGTIKNSKAGKAVSNKASQVSAAGKRYYEKAKNTKVGRGLKQGADAVKSAGNKLKNTKLGRAMSALANSKVGRFVGDTAGLVGKAGKRIGKGLAKQGVRAVGEFFYVKQAKTDDGSFKLEDSAALIKQKKDEADKEKDKRKKDGR